MSGVLTPEAAYAEVARITRARAKNFAYGIMLLPKPKRQAIAAIYAFAREVDDIADGDVVVPDRRAALNDLRGAVEAPSSSDPMQVALADAMRRYPIPRASLHALIDGGLQDLDQSRYATFDDLLVYCRRVAGAVGVACTAVYGPSEPSDDLAETLGVGLQLINIMRDVREDWTRGRVYLPQDELVSYGVTEDDIAAGAVTTAWQALMEHHAQRARAHVRHGLGLLDRLDRRSSACVAGFAGLYGATLDLVEQSGFDVYSGKPHLSPARKLAIVGGGLLR